MADPTAVTLLLMFFTAAPADIPPKVKKPELEKTVAWTLQSTQQVELSSADLCYTYATKVSALIAPVATMTLRAYCLCPITRQAYRDGKWVDECLDDNAAQKMLAARPILQFPPGVELIGPQSKQPSLR